MITTNIIAAVADYMAREAAANAPGGPGADVPSLLALVALDHQVNKELLKEGVRKQTVMPPN